MNLALIYLLRSLAIALPLGLWPAEVSGHLSVAFIPAERLAVVHIRASRPIRPSASAPFPFHDTSAGVAVTSSIRPSPSLTAITSSDLFRPFRITIPSLSHTGRLSLPLTNPSTGRLLVRAHYQDILIYENSSPA